MHENKNDVDAARARWQVAAERVSQLASQMFQPGSGYGEPQAQLEDEHHLYAAGHDAERFFEEYNDLYRRYI